MKRRLFSVTLCLTLLFALGGQALAADIGENPAKETLTLDESELAEILIEQESDQESPLPEVEVAAEPAAGEQSAAAGPDIFVNGVSIREQAAATVYQQTTYISLRAMAMALLPDAQVSWEMDGAQVQAAGLIVTARPGSTYLVANGRYLYVPDSIILDSGITLVPIRVIAKAIGASVSWDAATGNIMITGGSVPIEPGDSYYKSDAVYWLSHIINAESGSQPLMGKVAVGTVILNRVSSPLFPDTIYDVIFDCRGGSYQFSPARNGSIDKEPNTESVIAAKLCLDGAREASNSLFFNGVGQACWASRNRTLVTTIGGHNFYN